MFLVLLLFVLFFRVVLRLLPLLLLSKLLLGVGVGECADDVVGLWLVFVETTGFVFAGLVLSYLSTSLLQVAS